MEARRKKISRTDGIVGDKGVSSDNSTRIVVLSKISVSDDEQSARCLLLYWKEVLSGPESFVSKSQQEDMQLFASGGH